MGALGTFRMSSRFGADLRWQWCWFGMFRCHNPQLLSSLIGMGCCSITNMVDPATIYFVCCGTDNVGGCTPRATWAARFSISK